MNDTTAIYIHLLKNCMACPTDGQDDIAYELNPVMQEFPAYGHIEGTKEKYVAHELDWYLSQDLSIKGHPGIENNKVWQQCATEDGHINSNYGWCIFSHDNCDQYDHALNNLLMKADTKHAIMVYTRPNIVDEHHDGVHARKDMICTPYVQCFIRHNKLQYHVHMRSNDIWYGMRNDLAWHQWVYDKMYNQLRSQKYSNLQVGPIFWLADSLHLYKRNVDEVSEWLKSVK